MTGAFIIGLGILLMWVAFYKNKAQEMWKAVFGTQFKPLGT